MRNVDPVRAQLAVDCYSIRPSPDLTSCAVHSLDLVERLYSRETNLYHVSSVSFATARSTDTIRSSRPGPQPLVLLTPPPLHRRSKRKLPEGLVTVRRMRPANHTVPGHDMYVRRSHGFHLNSDDSSVAFFSDLPVLRYRDRRSRD